MTLEPLSDAAIDELCGSSDPTTLALAAEVRRLRNGIREHQRQTGHGLCWLNDLDLWRSLDPQADYPHTTLPVREEFFGQCRKYYESRLTGVEYEEPQPNTTIRVGGKAVRRPLIVAIRAGLAAGLVILPTACGKATSTGPTSYDVSYRLTTTSPVTFDSVKYEDAQGVLVKVVGPPSNWVVVLTVAAGGYVQASAWGLALSRGGSATLKVTWTASGISTASDSSTAAISSPGGFMLAVARRRL